MQLDSGHSRLFNFSVSRDLKYTKLFDCSLGMGGKYSITTRFPFRIETVVVPSANCAVVKTFLQRPVDSNEKLGPEFSCLRLFFFHQESGKVIEVQSRIPYKKETLLIGHEDYLSIFDLDTRTACYYRLSRDCGVLSKRDYCSSFSDQIFAVP